jgi:hypothetical protein
MQALYARCVGLDLHMNTIIVSLRCFSPPTRRLGSRRCEERLRAGSATAHHSSCSSSRRPSAATCH